MNLNQLHALFDYNYWANGRLLRAASALEQRELLAPAAQSHGSLRNNLVHILAVEWLWRTRCQEGTSPPHFVAPERFLELESIRVAWAEEERAMRAFLASLSDQRLSDPVKYTTRSGAAHQDLLWHILVHVVNHGTHHRAEVGLRLTELGHSPGDVDFIRFTRRR